MDDFTIAGVALIFGPLEEETTSDIFVRFRALAHKMSDFDIAIKVVGWHLVGHASD